VQDTLQWTSTEEARFWSYVQKTDDCWIWIGVRSGGYGRYTFRGKLTGAHRFYYELVNGPIAEGLQIDHLCRNRACVNPDHLEPVTIGENVLRGIGRSAQNARKTECLRGHPLNGSNLYIDPRGQRCCIICQRARVVAWRAKNA